MNEDTNTETTQVEPVVESAPVETSADQVQINRPDTTDTNTNTEESQTPDTQTDTKTPNTETETVETETDTETKERVTVEDLEELDELSKVPSPDEAPDLTDEYGYVDPNKLMQYLEKRDQEVAEHAVKTFDARQRAERIEKETWDNVYKDFPEVKTNETLEKALRGARILDITSGGDGDLARLASELVKPLRDSKVEAIEDVNRKITQQESLANNVQAAAAPEPGPGPSLMSQLRTALADGDHGRAQEIRNAIRMERIRDTTKM